MAKLNAFEPFFGMYLRTPVRHSVKYRSSRFASFTEWERLYLSPKRIIPLRLRTERSVHPHE
ncbi:MAG: hypothetical protein AB203_02845 [Parcubacteria bacterium C7867-008]|nr:MAG: hypothetical protein AB203_02845 [Parcubacteria bacterium C7867-008]